MYSAKSVKVFQEHISIYVLNTDFSGEVIVPWLIV